MMSSPIAETKPLVSSSGNGIKVLTDQSPPSPTTEMRMMLSTDSDDGFQLKLGGGLHSLAFGINASQVKQHEEEKSFPTSLVHTSSSAASSERASPTDLTQPCGKNSATVVEELGKMFPELGVEGQLHEGAQQQHNPAFAADALLRLFANSLAAAAAASATSASGSTTTPSSSPLLLPPSSNLLQTVPVNPLTPQSCFPIHAAFGQKQQQMINGVHPVEISSSTLPVTGRGKMGELGGRGGSGEGEAQPPPRRKRRVLGNADNTLDGLVAKRAAIEGEAVVGNHSLLPSSLTVATLGGKARKRYQSEMEAIELPDDETEIKRMESDPDVSTRQCSVCGYQGKWVSEMIRHKRVHTLERPFKCRFCNRTSKWKADLIRHVAKTHGIRVVSKYSRSKAYEAASTATDPTPGGTVGVSTTGTTRVGIDVARLSASALDSSSFAPSFSSSSSSSSAEKCSSHPGSSPQHSSTSSSFSSSSALSASSSSSISPANNSNGATCSGGSINGGNEDSIIVEEKDHEAHHATSDAASSVIRRCYRPPHFSSPSHKAAEPMGVAAYQMPTSLRNQQNGGKMEAVGSIAQPLFASGLTTTTSALPNFGGLLSPTHQAAAAAALFNFMAATTTQGNQPSKTGLATPSDPFVTFSQQLAQNSTSLAKNSSNFAQQLCSNNSNSTDATAFNNLLAATLGGADVAATTLPSGGGGATHGLEEMLENIGVGGVAPMAGITPMTSSPLSIPPWMLQLQIHARIGYRMQLQRQLLLMQQQQQQKQQVARPRGGEARKNEL